MDLKVTTVAFRTVSTLCHTSMTFWIPFSAVFIQCGCLPQMIAANAKSNRVYDQQSSLGLDVATSGADAPEDFSKRPGDHPAYRVFLAPFRSWNNESPNDACPRSLDTSYHNPGHMGALRHCESRTQDQAAAYGKGANPRSISSAFEKPPV